MSKIVLIISAIIFYGGIILIFIYIYKKINKENQIPENYSKVKGKCIDYNTYIKFENGDISTLEEYKKPINRFRRIENHLYYPIIYYEVDGKPYEISGKTGWNRKFAIFKNNYSVYYNPDNPHEAYIVDYNHCLFFGFIIFLSIILFLWMIIQLSYPEHEYQISCNVSGFKGEYTFVAKTEEEALEKWQESIYSKTCNILEIKKVK